MPSASEKWFRLSFLHAPDSPALPFFSPSRRQLPDGEEQHRRQLGLAPPLVAGLPHAGRGRPEVLLRRRLPSPSSRRIAPCRAPFPKAARALVTAGRSCSELPALRLPAPELPSPRSPWSCTPRSCAPSRRGPAPRSCPELPSPVSLRSTVSCFPPC